MFEQAASILRDNDRGGYCVPTARLYPYQWLWDSGFTALGWARFDEARAWTELRMLGRGQWPDGMIPHIIFHQLDPNYFPGPEAWGTTHEPPTSGITQPPVVATFVRWLLESAKDKALAQQEARALYPTLLAFHRWFRMARDPHGTGLVAILHPWESGMDNSAIWDEPMAAVPLDELEPYERRDTSHVAADQRPKQWYYDRYMALVFGFRNRKYDPARLFNESPFRVLDPTVNAILHRSDRDLLALARTLGIEEGQEELRTWIERGQAAFDKLWNERLGVFVPFDLNADRQIEVPTSAGLLPLYAGAASPAQARRMAQEVEAWGRMVRYLVPSTAPTDPRFEPRRYWRGPVWPNVNWLVSLGFRENGYPELADRIRADLKALIELSGFAEYFEPNTGEGLGGGHFTWTAATWLGWLEDDAPARPQVAA